MTARWRSTGLASHCPYLLDFYHTHRFPCGAAPCFHKASGTNSMTGLSGNLMVSLGGCWSQPLATIIVVTLIIVYSWPRLRLGLIPVGGGSLLACANHNTLLTRRSFVLRLSGPTILIGHAFTVCIRTENQNQMPCVSVGRPSWLWT